MAGVKTDFRIEQGWLFWGDGLCFAGDPYGKSADNPYDGGFREILGVKDDHVDLRADDDKVRRLSFFREKDGKLTPIRLICL